jgi:15-cis-phytoene synthase
MDDHCEKLVQLGDKDRYLATLFAPEKDRAHIFAIYAFDLEIRRIRDVVSEPAIGEIRQQWWLDTLDGIYASETPDHPIAQGLARAIEKGDLPKHAFRNLIIAHQFDFYSDPMATLLDLEGYLGETSSSIVQLASLTLAGYDALESAEAAGLAGVAYGMAKLLCSLALQRARQQCFIPADMLAKRESSSEDFLAAKNEVRIGVVLAELRQIARKRLAIARDLQWQIAKPARPAFLPIATTELYLDKLDKMDVSTLYRPAYVNQIWRQLKLWRYAKLEQF